MDKLKASIYAFVYIYICVYIYIYWDFNQMIDYVNSLFQTYPPTMGIIWRSGYR